MCDRFALLIRSGVAASLLWAAGCGPSGQGTIEGPKSKDEMTKEMFAGESKVKKKKAEMPSAGPGMQAPAKKKR